MHYSLGRQRNRCISVSVAGCPGIDARSTELVRRRGCLGFGRWRNRFGLKLADVGRPCRIGPLCGFSASLRKASRGSERLRRQAHSCSATLTSATASATSPSPFACWPRSNARMRTPDGLWLRYNVSVDFIYLFFRYGTALSGDGRKPIESTLVIIGCVFMGRINWIGLAVHFLHLICFHARGWDRCTKAS